MMPPPEFKAFPSTSCINILVCKLSESSIPTVDWLSTRRKRGKCFSSRWSLVRTCEMLVTHSVFEDTLSQNYDRNESSRLGS